MTDVLVIQEPRVSVLEIQTPGPQGQPGIGSSLDIEDEGSLVKNNPDFLNFTGSGVTASLSGNGVDIDITGGGAPGGNTGDLQYNNSGTLDGATGLQYNIGFVTYTIQSQNSSDQVFKIIGAVSQTAPLWSAEVSGEQRAILSASGRFAVGNWIPTSYAFETTSIGLRATSRYYVFRYNDTAGALIWERNDVSIGLQMVPGTTFMTLGPTGTSTLSFVLNTSLGDIYLTPGAAGLPKKIFFGKRTDSSTAVGASCEFWTAIGQVTSAWELKTPGGAATLTQLGVNGDLTIKVDVASKIVETAQAAVGQTANMKENLDSGSALLSGVSPSGGYFMKLTTGAPIGAGVTGELRFDPAGPIMYCYDGTVWRTSTFV